MRHAGRILAIAGIGLAALLFAREDWHAILDLVIAAGPGLVLAGLFHLVPMTFNARAWQQLLELPKQPTLRVMMRATWLRESVNGLLPVARIGGELVAFRVLRWNGVSLRDAAASLVADMALSVLSQTLFALAGLGILALLGRAFALTSQFAVALTLMLVLGIAFVLVQRQGVFGAVTGMLDRFVLGRLKAVLHESVQIDEALRNVYRRRRAVAACLGWQLIAWFAGAGEIWLALYYLGHPRSFIDAVVIEAVIQAISSAAFVVPGAIGVQEGGFLLIGAALGLDGATALALATARRLRDVIVFFPGLLAWQHAEARARTADAARETP